MSHIAAIQFAPASVSPAAADAPATRRAWLPLAVAMLVAALLVVALGFSWIVAQQWIQHGLEHAAAVVAPAQSLPAGR